MSVRGLRSVYLAGPDVFLPDAVARGAFLKTICTAHGLAGVYPLDRLENEPEEWSMLPEAQTIALRNEAHIRACDVLVANLTPFRGPSADVGTVFEMGFMRALGRPVWGWTNTRALFLERTQAFLAQTFDASNPVHGMTVERFGCVDNLMIDGAVLASGGRIVAADLPEAQRWTDLGAFARCIASVSAAFP